MYDIFDDQYNIDRFFVPCVYKTKICVNPDELTSDIKTILIKKLKEKYGNKYNEFGFIKEHTIVLNKILSCEREGTQLYGILTYYVEFSASVCLLSIRQKIFATITNISKIGFLAKNNIDVNIIIPYPLQITDKPDLIDNISVLNKTQLNDIKVGTEVILYILHIKYIDNKYTLVGVITDIVSKQNYVTIYKRDNNVNIDELCKIHVNKTYDLISESIEKGLKIQQEMFRNYRYPLFSGEVYMKTKDKSMLYYNIWEIINTSTLNIYPVNDDDVNILCIESSDNIYEYIENPLKNFKKSIIKTIKLDVSSDQEKDDFSYDVKYDIIFGNSIILSDYIREILIVLKNLKHNGSCVLRININIITKLFADIVSIINNYFDKVNIYIPQIACPINNDIYIVCTNFIGNNNIRMYKILYNIYNALVKINENESESKIINSIGEFIYDDKFIDNILYINKYLYDRRKEYLEYYQFPYKYSIDRHIEFIKSWCKLYNISIDIKIDKDSLKQQYKLDEQIQIQPKPEPKEPEKPKSKPKESKHEPIELGKPKESKLEPIEPEKPKSKESKLEPKETGKSQQECNYGLIGYAKNSCYIDSALYAILHRYISTIDMMLNIKTEDKNILNLNSNIIQLRDHIQNVKKYKGLKSELVSKIKQSLYDIETSKGKDSKWLNCDQNDPLEFYSNISDIYNIIHYILTYNVYVNGVIKKTRQEDAQFVFIIDSNKDKDNIQLIDYINGSDIKIINGDIYRDKSKPSKQLTDMKMQIYHISQSKPFKQVTYPAGFYNKYTDDNTKETYITKLTLISIIIHIGDDIESGHYICLVKCKDDNKWYIFDDLQDHLVPIDKSYIPEMDVNKQRITDLVYAEI